jgi:hypothetical protein
MDNTRKKSLRNLIQYKGMTDEEFDRYYEDILLKDLKEGKELNERVKRKIDELGNDYDLTDLKYNDLMQLTDLATAMITLEDFQEVLYKQQKSITEENIIFVDRLNKVISSVRSDISKIQTDLSLSRKIRKGEIEESVLDYIGKIRAYAKRKYEETMSYVYCPKCKMLLATTWFLYPDQNNSITVTCNRTLKNGKSCGNEFSIGSKKLIENRGHSEKGIFPE